MKRGTDQEGDPPGGKKKFMLCLGREGFGIGLHHHNAAMFLLIVGRKKWYMGSRRPWRTTTRDQRIPASSGTSRARHKCILQAPGEVLYVLDQWYHEICNLEYTAGIQALPD